MADVEIDPFGEHGRTEEPTDENIPLTPVRSTWEPEQGEQETSFGSPEVPLSRREILHKEYLVGEIYELIDNKTHKRLEPNLSLFELSTRLYDKRDDFDFHIVNFPYLSSNRPSGPSYGVYISQLIRYA